MGNFLAREFCVAYACSFSLLAGLTCIVRAGLWAVEMYETYNVYPEEVYTYMMVGIGLLIIAFLLAKFKGKIVTASKKDNRAFINKVWANKIQVGNKAVAMILITLVVIAIFNIDRAFGSIPAILCLGLIVTGFIFIMHDDEGDKWDQPKSRFMQISLWLIDYRNHPFSTSIILFLLVLVKLFLQTNCISKC